MAIKITRTDAPVGAFVSGFDLASPTESDRAELYQAFLDHGVLVFRGQEFNAAEMLAFSHVFGETKLHPIAALRLKEEPKLIQLAGNNGEPVADDDPTGDDWIGAIPWHTDLLYTTTPNRGALLRAVKLPKEGGETGWIDTAHAYRTLPTDVKKTLQGLRIVHSYAVAHGRQTMVGGPSDLFPDVLHPLVYVHPENDLPVLNISASSAKEIIGLPEDEAADLLKFLIEHSCKDDQAYVHQWQADDVVLWDNWRTMHRAFGHLKKYPRLMHRTTLGEPLHLGEWLGEYAPEKAQAA